MRPVILTPEQMRAKLAGIAIPASEEQVSQAVEQARMTAEQSKATEQKVANLSRKLETFKARKKMTPQEIREGMDLLFQKYDFSPVEELIITAQHTDDQSLSTRICMFLTEFLIPKLKSVEVSGTIDHQHTVVIRRFGPEGQINDTPVQRVPGLPVTNAPVKHVERVIDAEVVNA